MKLLLPTDFSDNARNAMEYALGMFSYADTEFILLNVYLEPHSSADMLVSINDILEKQSQQGLFNEYERLKHLFPKELIGIEQRTEYGELATVISKIVETENIDYVVMGTKGATGLKKVFMGSNTAEVIKKVKCPVLAIPENVRFKPPLHIALAADYGELKDRSILQPLTNLAQQYQSELSVVNIRPEGVFARAGQVVENIRLSDTLVEIPHSFYNNENDDVIEGIMQFVHEKRTDLLALIARQHNIFAKLLHKSVSRELTLISDLPLLVLHQN